MKPNKLIFTCLALVMVASCQEATELPEVVTMEAIRNDFDVTLRGEVISTGDDITTRGFCWSSSPNPNVEDNDWKLDRKRGLGEFIITLDNIEANQTYYFKAFAVNSLGVDYGEVRKFRGPYDNAQNAVINSRGCVECDNYSVGDTFALDQKVYIVADVPMLKSAILSGEDVTKYCTSKIGDMKKLFQYQSSFNQDIKSWDVSNVTRMEYLFDDASNFNADIGNWDLSSVQNAYAMFRGATSFNQNIGEWDVSNIENMIYMFFNANTFNQDLSQWCVPNISSLPIDFNTNSALSSNNLPIWGTCP